MIVRCGECGEEYQLGSNQKLSDYQCKCGGKLFSNKVVSENVSKKPKSMSKNMEKDKIIINRKKLLLLGLLFVFIGLVNVITLIIGILTLMIGLILFFTDSWGVYLVIFLLWLFGGILAFLFVPLGSIASWFGGVFVVLFGLGGLMEVGIFRSNKVKGHF